MNRKAFSEHLQHYLRSNGYSQKELADALNLNPKVLSRKLNGSSNAHLTSEEIERILFTLAKWHALTTVSEAQKLLELASLERRNIPDEVLSLLKEDRIQLSPSNELGKGLIESTLILHIRILEEPLTAQNLSTILSALTELSTKYWLITRGRFADLIEYAQTHNNRFAEEAHAVIAKASYNSPFNMDWKVDLSAPSVAEALVTTIDGIAQRQERLEKAKLENQAKAQEIKEVEQKSEMEKQMALLEQEKQRLELEQRRLEVLEKQLEVQKKGIEYALEIAGKVVDTLYPGSDPATRAMAIQALLPNIIQLQNGKGLELALPTPPSSAE